MKIHGIHNIFLFLALACSPKVEYEGHRGARGLFPENTLPAMEAALEYGMDVLEMDVVLTADSVAVLSHEPWISPEICLPDTGTLPDSLIPINRLSLNELRRFDCGSKPHPRFPEQQKMAVSKPSLRSVLQATEAWAKAHGREVKYDIETKVHPEWDGRYTPSVETVVRAIVRELEYLEIEPARVVIQSFDPRSLIFLRSWKPEYPLALLVEEPKNPEARIAPLGFTPEIYSANHEELTPGMIRAAHGLGMKVVAWTVNDTARMRELEALGVDGIITDYPNRVTRR